MSCKAVVPK